MEKLVYRCKSCGWEKSLPSQWADISPARCGNHKCKYSGRIKRELTSFRKEPGMLEIVMPEKKQEPVEHTPVSKAPEKVDSATHEKVSSKREKRRKNRGV